MEERASIKDTIPEFIKNNILVVVLTALGLLLCAIGIWQYISSKDQKDDIQFISSSEKVKGSSDTVTKISVDIEGSVQKPGVYEILEGSRLTDALIAAGGLASNADRDYVSKRLNLAQKVSDGAKVYIPAVGELDTKEVTSASNKILETVSTDIPDISSSLININTASMDSLDTLPKVGPATAQKIVSGRPYGTIEDLLSKKVLTQKTFEGLKDKITAE